MFNKYDSDGVGFLIKSIPHLFCLNIYYKCFNTYNIKFYELQKYISNDINRLILEIKFIPYETIKYGYLK